MTAQGVGRSQTQGRGFSLGPLATAGTPRWDGLAAPLGVCSRTVGVTGGCRQQQGPCPTGAPKAHFSRSVPRGTSKTGRLSLCLAPRRAAGPSVCPRQALELCGVLKTSPT